MFDLRPISRSSAGPVAFLGRAGQWLACVIVSISVVVLHAESGSSSPGTKNAGQQGMVDLATVTCRDFLQLPLPKALLLLGWVAGFNAALDNDTHVDPSAFLEKAERIISSCRKNGSMRVMNFAEKEMRRGRGPAEATPPVAPR